MRLRFLLALVLACSVASLAPALAQERFGGLTGTVTDQSGGAVPGATVTVTNNVTAAVRTTVSGGDGKYLFPDLVPGRYKLEVELSGFQKMSADDVLVELGKTFSLDAQLKIGELSEVVSVVGGQKRIDLSSVTLSHNVSAEEFDRLPKSRTFQGIALTSPGVNQGEIEAGFQVHGASGSENSYTIDGVVTNSIVDGRTQQDTVFEYLQEVQVKTSGVNAEYGGALGGVISAVTKSGGNKFNGEGHYYYLGSALSAGPIPRIQLSPVDNQTVFTPQDDKQPRHNNEFGGSVGGPIVRDRLFFFASASPRLVRRSNDYLFSNGTDPGSLSAKDTFTQAFGKITYAKGRVRANGSLLATPIRSTGRLSAFDGTGDDFIVSSQASNQPRKTQGYAVDQYSPTGDFSYSLTSASYLSARTGYFYNKYRDTGISQVTSYTYQRTSVGAANIPLSLQGPINTQNTPRTAINYFDTTGRGFFDADYNHAFSAAGSHSFKAGFGFQHSTNDVDYSYPGGYVYLYWNTAFASPILGSQTGTYGYYRVDDFATRGKVGGNIISLYAQDTWAVTPRLTLNIGLRTERETVPSFVPEIQENAFQFGFGEKLAPRLGASYDVRGDGRLKVSASWGRYFDWTKYSISRGSFGGDLWRIYYRSLDTLDIGSLNLNNMPGRDIWGSASGFRDLRGTAFDAIDPNTKPMFQDSTTAGVEYQWNPTTVFTATYIHNKLTRTIEDFSALIDGSNIYTIGNPGEGTATIYPASYPNASSSFAMPKPLRQYDALEIGLSRRFSKNWFASANYTLSRLYGNYSGLADSDEIATPTGGVTAAVTQSQVGSIARVGSNSHTAWDTDTIVYDSHGNAGVFGRLATDRPHVVKLFGAYTLKTGTQVGAFVYAGSGTPMSTLVNTLDIYPLLVEGRGDMGRTPVLSSTNLLVSHELKLRGTQKVRFELNVLNIFNQKTATHIFNFLNKGAPGGSSTIPADAIDMSHVNLQAGYDYRALILASQDGALAFDPRYGKPDLWQTGTQGQFSIKWIF